METILNKESRAAIELMVADGIIAKDTAERYFPELKESEDERIRKDMLEYCYKRMNNEFSSITIHQVERWLAWLEKQGEQKPVGDKILCNPDKCMYVQEYYKEQKSIEFHKSGYTTNKNVIEYADKYSHEVWEKLMDKFNKIANYSIGCNDVSDIVLNAIINSYNYFYDKQKPVEWINELEEKLSNATPEQLKEWKEKYFKEESVEWSEEDEIGLADALYCIEVASKNAKDENDMGNAWYAERWLKSLKDRCLPQPQQEWSKEDKVMLDEIIDFFENGTVKLQHDLSLYASWLKSLRPQRLWKPTEEQMEALVSAIDVMIDNRGAGDKNTILLSGLFHELKAL